MPNPVVDIAQMNYKLDDTADVQFEIYDLTGKLVKNMNMYNQATGEHQVNFDVNEFEAGTYLIRMTANGQQTTAKFMIR